MRLRTYWEILNDKYKTADFEPFKSKEAKKIVEEERKLKKRRTGFSIKNIIIKVKSNLSK